MLNAGSPIDKVVYLALEHWLKVLLHLASSHLDHDRHIHMPLGSNSFDARTNDINFSINNLFERRHGEIFEAAGMLTAKFNAHIIATDDFAFEGGSIWNRYRHIGHLDLHTAHLDAFLHQAFGFFQIIFTINSVEGQADHMLLSCYTSGEDLWNHRICNDWEAKVYSTGGRSILQIIHITQVRSSARS